MDIHKTLVERLSLDDLRNLCFHIGIDYENLDGNNKSAKIRELIMHVRRTEREADLLRVGQQIRPDIEWKQLTWPNKFVPPRPPIRYFLIISIIVLIIIFIFVVWQPWHVLESTPTSVAIVPTAISTATFTLSPSSALTYSPTNASLPVEAATTVPVISASIGTATPTTITPTSTLTPLTLTDTPAPVPPTDTLTPVLPTITFTPVPPSPAPMICGNFTEELTRIISPTSNGSTDNQVGILHDLLLGTCVLNFASESFVEVTHNDLLEPGNGTIEFVFKVDDADSTFRIAKQRSPNLTPGLTYSWTYDLRVSNLGSNFIWVDADPTDKGGNNEHDNQSCCGSSIQIGCWNHVAISWDNGTISFFVNSAPRVTVDYQIFADANGIERGLAFTQTGVLRVSMQQGSGEIGLLNIYSGAFDTANGAGFPKC